MVEEGKDVDAAAPHRPSNSRTFSVAKKVSDGIRKRERAPAVAGGGNLNLELRVHRDRVATHERQRRPSLCADLQAATSAARPSSASLPNSATTL